MAMDRDSLPKAGYVACALASVVLAVLASALPYGIVRTVSWISLFPFVLGFPYMTRRFGVRMGGRRFVIAYAILFGLFWLLLGAGALGVQVPFDQLYTVWVVAFVALVCAQCAVQGAHGRDC
ncbi:hypothetical protein DW781_05570 [Olsenella sp. AM30-3LB]|nr:hypothetical protein DW781_05570 [Olsenella sp. AM30-3LB]